MSMPPFRRLVLPAVLLAASLTAGCNKEKAPAATNPAPAAAAGEMAPDTVVATYGEGQKVTYAELNDRIKDPLADLEKQKYELRKRGLEGLVVERLVDAEAKKRGMTQEQYLKAEIDDKLPVPPEEEMKKMYEEAKSRLPPDATYEKVRPQIISFLAGPEKQKRAREVFEGLKKQANVQMLLPEPPRERKEVAAVGPAKGPESAPVTIVEFSDFQCPFCSRVVGTVDQVVKEYGDKVRVVFRHMPLEIHPQAPKAAEASLCANEQGKFWEYHDKLFQNQQALEVDKLKSYAADMKLDTAKFNECLDSGRMAAKVKEDMEAASKVGVNGTPAFFINGVFLNGAQPIEEFKSIIDSELKAKGKG